MRTSWRAAGLAAALLVWGAAGRASAQNGAGSFGAQFLAIDVGARSASMGGAFTGLADDVHSLSYNPAGLAYLRRQEIGLLHNSFAPGVNQEWAGYVWPTPWGALGGSANILSVAPFDSFDQQDAAQGKTSAMDSAYQGTYAAQLTDFFAIGGSAKYITSRLDTYTARSIAFDGGALWKPSPLFAMGAAVLNIGPGLTYIGETAGLPTTMRAGLSWSPFDPKDYANTLTIAADVVKPRNELVYVASGLEFWYADMLCLRGGARTGSAIGSGYTLGAGLAVHRRQRGTYELEVDYSYINAGDFATTQRVGIVLKFGEPWMEGARTNLFRKDRTYEEEVIRPRKAQFAPSKQDSAPRLPAATPSYERLPGGNDTILISP